MDTTDRPAARLQFARDALQDSTLALEPASADASFRSYWRTHHQGRSWIVMDSPPALEDPRPWLAIGERLAAAGLHVPAVLVKDLEQGLLLIEDLGTQMYLPALNEASVDALYGDAMAALLRMQSRVDASNLPPYDGKFLARELAIMPDWFLGQHLGHALDEDEKDTIERAFSVLLDSALEQPTCFVHRDFHSRNLLLIEGDSPAGTDLIASPGIIDFQGALRGPITYDLASLLRDSYVVWDTPRVESWVRGYHAQLRDIGLLDAQTDAARFHRWFELIGLQRHLKVLGIFCRLAYRDGKPGYLADLPRVFRYVIDTCLRHAELTSLAELLVRHAGDRDLTCFSPA